MDCPTEEAIIRNALEPLAGVQSLAFNLLERELTITHSYESNLPLVEALDRLEMGPLVRSEERSRSVLAEPKPSPWWKRRGLLLLSGLAATAAEAVAYGTGNEASPGVVALAVTSLAAGGVSTIRKGIVAVRSLSLNINFLMTVAIIGAAAIGQWPEAAMVTFLFAVAEEIEKASLERARDAVRGLLAITPPTAFRRAGTRWLEIDTSEISPGDVIRVRPGERIVVDGFVLVGSGSVNQAPITGESVPVEKVPGDSVFAGTLNHEGLLEVNATRAAGETTLAKIARSIQQAQATRAPTQRFIDSFSKVYTPFVVTVALAVTIVPILFFAQPAEPWIYRGLVLLVIACPCALVISTPVTVVSGLAAAARAGILIKGGSYLEAGYRLRAVALDKTGTITEGRPALTDIIPLGEESMESVLGLAAALESGSDHPIALAVVAAWQGLTHNPPAEVQGFSAIVGRGVEGLVGGRTYRLGSQALAEQAGLATTAVRKLVQRLETEAKTTMLLLSDELVLGVIAVADRERKTSVEAIAMLAELGVESVMLTGDNEKTGRAIATRVGIQEVHGNLMPDDKVRAISVLLSKHGSVGMVGDGINDAPALARATVGFAMGTAGTDTAIETAGVAFMDDDLRKLPQFIKLSKRTRAVLIQNIAFSLGVKAVFLTLSAFGVATLWMAIFADIGASLIVVANGLRVMSNTSAIATGLPTTRR